MSSQRRPLLPLLRLALLSSDRNQRRVGLNYCSDLPGRRRRIYRESTVLPEKSRKLESQVQEVSIYQVQDSRVLTSASMNQADCPQHLLEHRLLLPMGTIPTRRWRFQYPGCRSPPNQTAVLIRAILHRQPPPIPSRRQPLSLDFHGERRTSPCSPSPPSSPLQNLLHDP